MNKTEQHREEQRWQRVKMIGQLSLSLSRHYPFLVPTAKLSNCFYAPTDSFSRPHRPTLRDGCSISVPDSYQSDAESASPWL